MMGILLILMQSTMKMMVYRRNSHKPLGMHRLMLRMKNLFVGETKLIKVGIDIRGKVSAMA